ncbi:MAG: NAD(P)-dependent oxidoreductase [Thermodesulfobacteriota bacterium]
MRAARRTRGFHMKILYYSRRHYPEIEIHLGVVYISLEELLKESDFVSLHPKYTPETHHYDKR